MGSLSAGIMTGKMKTKTMSEDKMVRIEWKSFLRLGISAFLLYLATRYWTGAMNLAAVVISAAFPLAMASNRRRCSFMVRVVRSQLSMATRR